MNYFTDLLARNGISDKAMVLPIAAQLMNEQNTTAKTEHQAVLVDAGSDNNTSKTELPMAKDETLSMKSDPGPEKSITAIRAADKSEGTKSTVGKGNNDSDKTGSPPETKEEKERAKELQRKEHEEKEAIRKAEWEATQESKKIDADKKWQSILEMDAEYIGAVSAAHVGAATEMITRRNMKDHVSEFIQSKCMSDIEFARLTMHPRKSMVNCFRYITKKAFDFAMQEVKDNDIELQDRAYGTDIPDDLCYRWAEEYFYDMEAEVDKCKDDEFKPKPFYGGPSVKTAQKKDVKKETKKGSKPKTEAAQDSGQLSLLEAQ